MVVRDVRTRWNYTHAMIRRGLLVRDVRERSLPFDCRFPLLIPLQAVDEWVFRTPEVADLGLSRSDWALLEKIADLLEVCM